MTTRTLWYKPQLRTDEDFEEHRPVTWLELFFDLVFVVIISTLAHNLSSDISPQGVLIFALAFIPVFWVWTASTYYTERFEAKAEGLETRLTTFVTMITVAGMAVFAHHGFRDCTKPSSKN